MQQAIRNISEEWNLVQKKNRAEVRYRLIAHDLGSDIIPLVILMMPYGAPESDA